MASGKDTYLWKDRRRRLGMPLSFTRYMLTEKKLYVTTGLFNIQEEEVLLYRVLDIHMKSSLMDRMVGQGTICLHSRDITTPEITLKNVKRPYEVRDLISSLVEQNRAGISVREVHETNDIYETDHDDHIL